MADDKNMLGAVAVQDVEVAALRAELAELREREAKLEETRRAMLFLLEDINEKSSDIEKAKNEWEYTFDAISSPIYIHDEEYRIVRCNRAYAEVAGLGFKELIGRPYYEVFPLHDGPLDICKDQMDSEYSVGGTATLIESSGRTYSQRVYRIRQPETSEMFSLHVMEDITDAMRAERRDKLLAEFSTRVAADIKLHSRLRLICETIMRLDFSLAWVEFPSGGRTIDAGTETEEHLEEGWPGVEAIAQRAPVVRNHLERAGWFAPYRDEAVRLGHRSLGSFPMLVGEEVVGVLNIYHGADVFPAREMDFLASFAANAGVYIRNSLLYEDLRTTADHLAAEAALNRNLLKLAEGIAHTRDVGMLLNETTVRVRGALGCDLCLAYIYRSDERILTPTEGAGLSTDMAAMFRVERIGVDVPFIASAVQGLRPVRFMLDGSGSEDRPQELASALELYEKLAPGLTEIAAIPLFAREGQLLGVLLCLSVAGHGHRPPFTDRDENLMRGISQQVSMALEETRLYVETMRITMDLTRKVETIQTMHEIDRSILSTLEPAVVLDMAVMMVGKLISCDIATVCMVDKDKGGLVYRAGFGTGDLERGLFIPMGETLLGDVVTSGRARFTADLSAESSLSALERRFIESGIVSSLTVPLTVKSGVVGALSLWSKRMAAYTPDDLSTLEKLSSQISIAFENSRLLVDLEELFIGVVRTLSEAIDAKSPWTRGHSDRVTALAVEIGGIMGLEEADLKTLELAGLLHDIGKLGTYESILEKPGKLTPEEAALMRQHPTKGAEILAPIRQMKEIVPAIRHHHEYFDGTGYPDGISGMDIPPFARILAVADTVDAMSSDRPYRKGRSMKVIIDELNRCSGTQFDPEVVGAFMLTQAAQGASAEYVEEQAEKPEAVSG